MIKLLRDACRHAANLFGLRPLGGDWIVTMDDDLKNPTGLLCACLDGREKVRLPNFYLYAFSVQQIFVMSGCPDPVILAMLPIPGTIGAASASASWHVAEGPRLRCFRRHAGKLGLLNQQAA